MKKSLQIISMILSAAILFGTASAGVYADGPGYTKKDVTAYYYSLEQSDTISCLFFDALPGEPYMKAVDFLTRAYTKEFTVSEEDGVFRISRDDSYMTVDPESEKIFFDDFYVFTTGDAYSEGSLLESDFIETYDSSVTDGDKSVSFDLSKYGFDVVEEGGDVYFPVCLISDIFVGSYNGAVYLDDCLYFYHTMDWFYFDREEIFNVTERDAATAQYTYDLLCFMFDELFGFPTNAEISGAIAEKGFDRALEEYDETTKAAKELLLSTDMIDYYTALLWLYPYFNDGGHTDLIYDPVTAASTYPDTKIGQSILELVRKDPKTESEQLIYDAIVLHNEICYYCLERVRDARDAAFAQYEPVKSWKEDDIYLYAHGDTVVFVFDAFYNNVLEPFKWSLDYAVENGYRNFILDDSTYSGGSTAVLEFILTAITAAKEGDNESVITWLDVVTGLEFSYYSRLDLDLDGDFDEDDAAVSYDLNFAILTSRASFSCGNDLPILGKEKGIPILGETSGGGSCNIYPVTLPDGLSISMSGGSKGVCDSGADFDLGAQPDFELVTIDGEENIDYSALFDIEHLSELIRAFYHVDGDVNDDGKINSKDVISLMKFIVGIAQSGAFEDYADFNGDGRVNSKDVIALMKAIVAS